MKKKPNIIFISFDAGRGDRMGYGGYKPSYTPFLDAIALKSAVFLRAFSTGPGSPHSFVGTLTSTHPFDYGGFAYIDRPRVMISEVLHDAGYMTIGVHSAGYMSSYFGYDRGWDTYAYLSPFKTGGIMKGIRGDTWQSKVLKTIGSINRSLRSKVPLVAFLFRIVEKTIFTIRKIIVDIFRFRPAFLIAEEINEEVEKRVPGQTEQPLFLWVHFMDTHAPYGLFWRKTGTLVQKCKYWLCDIAPMLAGGLTSPLLKMIKSLYREIYDASLRYTDKNIERLYATLTKKGIINDESIVVIFSDHGEEFFDHGGVGHRDTLYYVNQHVPLLFHAPAHIPQARIERPVSLIDVAPTVLELAGITKPTVFKGGNIFDATERAIIGQVPDSEADLSNQTFLGASLVYGGYRMVKMIDATTLCVLDDVLCENNLYAKEPEIAKKLETMLEPYTRICGPTEMAIKK